MVFKNGFEMNVNKILLMRTCAQPRKNIAVLHYPRKKVNYVINIMIFKKQLLIFTPPIILVVALFPPYLCYLSNLFFSKIIFFVAAIVSIYIYSRYAFEIHDIIPKRTKIIDIVENKESKKQEVEKSDWYIYNQYWLNGFGAFVGWLALYILIFYRIEVLNGEMKLAKFIENIEWPKDYILALVAFFGITGYFPFASLLGRIFGK